MSPPQICDLGPSVPLASVARIAALGFNYLAADSVPAGLKTDLPVIVNIDLSETTTSDPFVLEHPEWFAVRRTNEAALVANRREHLQLEGCAYARLYAAPDEFAKHWRGWLHSLIASGAAGFRLRHPERVPPSVWQSLIADIRTSQPGTLFFADLAGVAREELPKLELCGFDYCLGSLAWWDFQSSWLVEEYQAAARIAPVISVVGAGGQFASATESERRARYALAPVAGSGIWMPFEFLGKGEVDACVAATNASIVSDNITASRGALSKHGHILLRTCEPDQRMASEALAAFVNPNDIVSPAPASFEDWDVPDIKVLAPREVRVLRIDAGRLCAANRQGWTPRNRASSSQTFRPRWTKAAIRSSGSWATSSS